MNTAPSRLSRARVLRDVLKRELSLEEDPATAVLIGRLRHVKRRGSFSRAEFLAMCGWKSPRAKHQYERNAAAAIRRVSRAMLATRSERRRIELLTSLRGVRLPMASAILTLIDPTRYGVIDIRVWQLLFDVGAVGRNPQGRGFGFEHWDHYLVNLRYHARELGVPVRAVEYTLFRCHRKYQRGRLYDRRDILAAGSRGPLSGRGASVPEVAPRPMLGGSRPARPDG